jgi:hypothetical protein
MGQSGEPPTQVAAGEKFNISTPPGGTAQVAASVDEPPGLIDMSALMQQMMMQQQQQQQYQAQMMQFIMTARSGQTPQYAYPKTPAPGGPGLTVLGGTTVYNQPNEGTAGSAPTTNVPSMKVDQSVLN